MWPNTKSQIYLKPFFWSSVSLLVAYLMCGPRQLFFQCGWETPKGQAPVWDQSPLSDMWLKIFSPSSLSCHFFKVSFIEQKFLILMKSNLSFFVLLWLMLLMSHLRTTVLGPELLCSENFSLRVSGAYATRSFLLFEPELEVFSCITLILHVHL